MEEKQIAKEILIKLIECDKIYGDDFPDAKATIDVYCEAYKKILSTIHNA